MKIQQKDLKKGDIIRFIFGDFDNVVTGIVDNVEDDGTPYGCKVEFRYLTSNRYEVMYGHGWSLVDVVDKE